MTAADWRPSPEYLAYCERVRTERAEPRLLDACESYVPCAESWRANVIPGCDTCQESILTDPACPEFRRRWARLLPCVAALTKEP